MLLNPGASFDLARRLQQGSAPVGELFAFVSGLYFRGKMAYSAAFGNPPPGLPAALVITAGVGLVPTDTLLSGAAFGETASIPIDLAEPRYREPLKRDCGRLAETLPLEIPVILLGSIATPKYVDPLLEVFGSRLLFPAEFVGRGDMSRGGLMLRAARSGSELQYVPVAGATRRGSRPERLPKLR